MIDQLQLSGDLNWNCLRQIQQEMLQAVNESPDIEFELDFAGVRRVYPNGVVPLIVLLDHLRTERRTVCRVTHAEHPPPMLAHDYLFHLDPQSGQVVRGGASAVHAFRDDHELNVLINQKIDQVLSLAQFAPGVLTAFEWFLNEIAGNVLVHAQGMGGWLQVVVHPSTQRLAVVVADGGIGIPESIRSASNLQLRFGSTVTDGEAIEISLRDGVTSKPDFGQGKGLTGTMAIVKANPDGRLAITSQAGRVFYAPNSIGLKVEGNQPPFPGTVVDVQLGFAQPLEIEKALWGHVPVNFTETVYGKDTPVGIMKLALRDQAPSFGNRITAKRIRQKIENLLAEAPTDALEVDFEGVTILASSFADEVFGKLAAELGVIQFSRRLKFIHLNAFCQGVIDDVVQARMAQTYVNRNARH